MPVNAGQLAAGANYQLASYAKNDPVDQFTSERPFADWLIRNKQESSFGNGIFNEKVRITNDSNYQNYTGDDQVTYNRKDTVRLAPFMHYEAHDGFALNETELADNNIVMTDDKNAVMSDAEQIQIVNKLKECYATLKDGFQENWDSEVHRDGSQSTLAVPGLDALVSVDGTGTIGGIDASASTWWKNNFNTGINTSTAGTLIAAMETEWRKCVTHGKMGSPNAIFCGSKFLDAYAKDCRATNSYQVSTPSKGGVQLDGSRSGVFFKGIELVWDPTMDTLQAALDPAIDWDKRCYFLNSKALVLRPNRGRWMVNRKPPRIYDRYTYYFGLTADYGLTVKQRNAMSILSIA
jgi:hypothetical protein